LHTHDETGVIHIESPIRKDFTLGQFLDIWRKKLGSTSTFANVFGGKNILTIYINGSKLPAGTNYKDIKLHVHNEIAIVFGSPPISIPSSYEFPQGL
jgi:hypothetical protein